MKIRAVLTVESAGRRSSFGFWVRGEGVLGVRGSGLCGTGVRGKCVRRWADNQRKSTRFGKVYTKSRWILEEMCILPLVSRRWRTFDGCFGGKKPVGEEILLRDVVRIAGVRDKSVLFM